MLALDPNAQISSSIEVNPGIVEIPVTKQMPPGFNPTLWTLLQDINNSGVPLRGKIAEYAGFYLKIGTSITTEWDSDPTHDNGTNPDMEQTLTSQPNKSLDKLTFMIMFRLPFSIQTANIHYGDPITGPNTSWSYRANQLRIANGLFRLNQTGEQVNDNDERCDDSGTSLDSSPGELNTSGAYLYYNKVGSDLSGVVATAVMTQPLYLYLAVITEGRFKPEAGDTTLSVVQIPENIVGLMGSAKDETSTLYMTPPPVLRRRAVILGIYSTTGFEPSTSIPNFAATYPVDGAIVKKETSGAHINEYYVLPTNLPSTVTSPRIYVRLKYPAEELGKNGTHTKGAVVFEMAGLEISKAATTSTDAYARYFTRDRSTPKFGFTGSGDIQFENLAIVNQSGVTLGWGYDIGQGNREDFQYKIQFKIWAYALAGQQPTGTTQFELRYKDRSSSKINFTASADAVETALLSLLGLKKSPWPYGPRTITVTKVANSGDANYPTRWDVTIIRANMDPNGGDKGPFSDQTGANGFFNIYSSNVFYQPDADDEPVNPNIKITPVLEKDRYILNTAASAVTAWTNFTLLLNKFFGGVDWRDPSHFINASAQEISDFENMLRGCYSIRRGNAFLPVFNQQTLLRKFKLPNVELLFPRWVTDFVRPKYYDKKIAKLSSDVKDRTNAAEKYVLTTIAYGGNLNKNDDLEEAIKTKNLEKLIAVVNNRNQGDTFRTRRTTIVKHLAPTLEQMDEGIANFKKYLYRNIEED